MAGDELDDDRQLPAQVDPNLVALGHMIERAIEPVARAEAERARQETEQLRVFLSYDWKKHVTYGIGVACLLAVAVGSWHAGEITGAAILTHFGAIIAGFTAGRQSKSE